MVRRSNQACGSRYYSLSIVAFIIEKFLFLLLTGSNVSGERNSASKEGLYRKGHLEDIKYGQVRVISVERAATRDLSPKDLAS